MNYKSQNTENSFHNGISGTVGTPAAPDFCAV